MIFNHVFGELNYDFGFEKKISLTLFEHKVNSLLLLTAYSSEDMITVEQEKSYNIFRSQETSLLKQAEELLTKTYGSKAKERFHLTTLLIGREGELALLLDDSRDLDEGIALQLLPEIHMSSQSDYL